MAWKIDFVAVLNDGTEMEGTYLLEEENLTRDMAEANFRNVALRHFRKDKWLRATVKSVEPATKKQIETYRSSKVEGRRVSFPPKGRNVAGDEEKS